jgi:hypothetical protein
MTAPKWKISSFTLRRNRGYINAKQRRNNRRIARRAVKVVGTEEFGFTAHFVKM